MVCQAVYPFVVRLNSIAGIGRAINFAIPDTRRQSEGISQIYNIYCIHGLNITNPSISSIHQKYVKMQRRQITHTTPLKTDIVSKLCKRSPKKGWESNDYIFQKLTVLAICEVFTFCEIYFFSSYLLHILHFSEVSKDETVGTEAGALLLYLQDI